MRLYHWPDAPPVGRALPRVRLAPTRRAGSGPGYTAIPLSASPPRAAERYVSVEIPKRIAELFRVREGRYLIPASVVRAYHERERRHPRDT